jgi:hydroxyacylglutathione hydrolase
VRRSDAFGAGHPAGAINICFGQKVGYWAAWIVPPATPIVLLLDETPNGASEIRRQLLRVGLDDVAGYIDGGFDGWTRARLPAAVIEQIAASGLHDPATRGRLTIVDVRTRKEWEAGHIPGALHVALGELPRRAAAIPGGGIVATICEGGLRSSLAASLLARAGLPRVVNVHDGMAGWRLRG